MQAPRAAREEPAALQRGEHGAGVAFEGPQSHAYETDAMRPDAEEFFPLGGWAREAIAELAALSHNHML
eukprot:3022844-Alexandrium_andersonii.AAC.1